MDNSTQNEILLLTQIDNVKGNESIKILSICSSVLSSEKYVSSAVEALDNIFNSPDFDLTNEFTRVVVNIFNVNKKFNYYKEISTERTKYVVWGVFYHYLQKHQADFLNSHDMGVWRLLFANAWDLITIIPQTVKIDKASCICGWCSDKTSI